MPSNPWVALDAAKSPALRGRELRQIWDDYLSDGRLDHVRLPIADSWHRSEGAGFDPALSRAPTLFGDRREVRERWEEHPLSAAAPLIRRWLGRIAEEDHHVIVVSDAKGMLLWLDGDARVRSAAADAMNFVEGALWSEAGAGTNAVGIALAADHPVQVHAAEHFSEVVHGWTCSAVPVHHPEDGRLLGVIDLTGAMTRAHPRTLAAVMAAARAVEADLRVRTQLRDAQLRVRYLDRMESTRRSLAIVRRTGRVIADHSDGFGRAARIEVPPDGGVLLLPDGRRAIAEALDSREAYVVREERRSTTGRSPKRPAAPSDSVAATAAELEALSEWRRAELELSHLAEEQAALRRVATRVAGQATADEIFATVAKEVAQLLGVDRGTVCRYEPDGMMTVMAYSSTEGGALPVGTRVELDGDSVASMVQQLGRPSRVDSYEGRSGPVIDLAVSLGNVPRASVGAPILVEGRVWGAILAASTRQSPFDNDTESRLMGFAELVATAISNAVARDELNASRARIVAAADDSRRRIERDLHDGAQQRLVALALQLRSAARDESADFETLRDELVRGANSLAAALDELREISRGIHPAVLSRSGLAPALRALARRSAIPVEIDITTFERFDEGVELAAYYVVSELLTNAAKHSKAEVVRLTVEQLSRTLHLSINDDGVGGADMRRGSGLIGLRDRVEAIRGTFVVDSPAGAGTSVEVSLPLHLHPLAQPRD